MLKGTLDDFTLPDVLRLVAAARRTGRLDVTRHCGGGRLWFRDGTVAGAAPGYERRHPAPTPEGCIEDLAFDLMRWDLGEFTWAAGGDDVPSAASVDVAGLLDEVSRRLRELAEVQTLVPSEHAVLAWAPQPPEGAVQINITPAEWRVLVLVDGHRSVGEIASSAGLDDVETMTVLFGLAGAGLVRAVDTPAPPAGLPEQVSDTTDMTAMSDLSDTPGEPEHVVVPAPEPEPEPEPAAEAPEPEPEPEPAAEAREEDPFLAGFVAAEPPSPVAAPAAPLPEAAAENGPSVDRSTAARELAGLFDLPEPAGGFVTGAMVPSPPRTPRRVEDDDEVTRGLISRLIDGVKGL